jgi:hypothetical protein
MEAVMLLPLIHLLLLPVVECVTLPNFECDFGGPGGKAQQGRHAAMAKMLCNHLGAARVCWD